MLVWCRAFGPEEHAGEDRMTMGEPNDNGRLGDAECRWQMADVARSIHTEEKAAIDSSPLTTSPEALLEGQRPGTIPAWGASPMTRTGETIEG